MRDNPIRVAVIGAGEFGRNHVRIWKHIEGAQLVGVLDTNAERAAKVCDEFGSKPLTDFAELKKKKVQAVSLAVPTREHASVGCKLLEAGFDVLVEKPMAATVAEADALIAAAKKHGRILQVGHVERFNPATLAVQPLVAAPMFFEIHRLGIFTPRSLDVDVVYDVMIHDLDILVALVNAPITDLKAVGIPVVTDKIDIAQARIEFETGTVANLTASRVSTERIRKMRFFQAHEYISVDFTRQDVLRVRVNTAPGATGNGGGPKQQPNFAAPDIQFEKVPTLQAEPLHAELQAFLESVKTRKAPMVDGAAGRRALELADRVMAGILEHAGRVQLGAFAPQLAR
jgi:predicted dehydrogenase